MARDLYIVDLVTQDRLTIQFVPQELDYNPASKWAVLASNGRNNPLYHYTGSEDTLSFQLDWHAEEDSREDVIRRCRWLEALSKANAFDEKPHHIALIWSDKLFTDFHTWIVAHAPYKMSMFHGERSMLPTQAYQQVTLKRVTEDNLTYDDIRKL